MSTVYYFAYFDPTTTLVTAVTLAGTTLTGNVISLTQAQYDSIQQNPQGWWVSSGVLQNPTTATTLLWYQKQQIQALENSYSGAISQGLATTINGSSYTILLTNRGTSRDGIQELSAAIVSQRAIDKATQWVSGQVVAANSFVTDGASNYFITFTGGTTGTTIPTWPTAFSTPVTDNTVTWYKMGFRVSTTSGLVLTDPTSIVSLFAQSVNYINNLQYNLESLSNQVMAATTPAAVQAIVW